MKVLDIILESTNTSNSIIDNVNGLGSVPNNMDVDYLGLRVEMLPDTFLKLAAPLTEYVSTEHIQSHLSDGGRVGSPYLDIELPPIWGKISKILSSLRLIKKFQDHNTEIEQLERQLEQLDTPENLTKETARIYGHEGRNRMMAIKEKFGNIPVETHLFFGKYRRYHISSNMAKQLNSQLINESGQLVTGPFFEHKNK